MSKHYNRYERAAPGSFMAVQTDAWLQHSARFRPKLVELQGTMRKIVDGIKGKKHSLTDKQLKKLTKDVTDYIVFSGSSFLEYLCTYEAAYLCELLERRGHTPTEKHLTALTSLFKISVKARTDKVKSKKKKKHKAKPKKKK